MRINIVIVNSGSVQILHGQFALLLIQEKQEWIKSDPGIRELPENLISDVVNDGNMINTEAPLGNELHAEFDAHPTIS